MGHCNLSYICIKSFKTQSQVGLSRHLKSLQDFNGPYIKIHQSAFKNCIVICIHHVGLLMGKQLTENSCNTLTSEFLLYKMLTNCKISCKQQTSTQIEEICNYETFTFRRRAYSHLRKTERRNGLSGPHRTSNSFLLEMSMTIPCVSVCSKYKEKGELNCRANIA